MATLLLLFTSLIIACSSLPSMAQVDCRLGVTLIRRPTNQTLREACDSGCYTYLVLEGGNLLSPRRLGFAGDDDVDGINYCQSKGVKVLLSLDGFVFGNQSLFRPEFAAFFVWQLFLNPNNGMPDRADGINFGFTTGSDDYFRRFAQALKNYSNQIILSASPGCAYPSPNFNSAISDGLIDLVWPKFFNNRDCDYSGGITGVVSAWSKWHDSIPVSTKLLFGLPTSPEVAESGYMTPDEFAFNVLPNIRWMKKYAGAMLWNLEHDTNSLYASQIAQPLCDFTGPVKCRAGSGAAGRITLNPVKSSYKR